MRVLVTGGGGYIGREIALALSKRGDAAIALDTNFPSDERFAAAKQLHLVQADITDLASLVAAFQKEKPDIVIHCAAIVGVMTSINSPSNIVRVNVQGSVNVFDAMRLAGVRRVVHTSTEEVYGNFLTPVVDEEHPQRPCAPYGTTKLAVEHLSRSYRDQFGLDPIHMRTSWVYGVGLPRPRPPTTFLDAALEGKPFHMDHGGDAAIDFTYMDDVVSGVLSALDARAPVYDVYNLASGKATTLTEIVAIIKDLLPGADITVKPGRYRFSDKLFAPTKGALNMTRAKSDLGFEPKFSMRSGLEAYIETWRALAAKHQRRGT